jgi:hypothetical protein
MVTLKNTISSGGGGGGGGGGNDIIPYSASSYLAYLLSLRRKNGLMRSPQC